MPHREVGKIPCCLELLDGELSVGSKKEDHLEQLELNSLSSMRASNRNIPSSDEFKRPLHENVAIAYASKIAKGSWKIEMENDMSMIGQKPHIVVRNNTCIYICYLFIYICIYLFTCISLFVFSIHPLPFHHIIFPFYFPPFFH